MYHKLAQQFCKDTQKAIGWVNGMGGDKDSVTAVGTIRWTFDYDSSGVSHAFLIPGSSFITE
jgi:hypothetical protein